jgi:hypothetical protein
MRFINLYLVGWIIFVLGIGLGLWKAGLDVSPVWIGIGIVVAIGIGIMMSVSSGKPTVTHDT